MKNIALLAAILSVGFITSACTNEVSIRPNAEVTLADGAVVSCAEGERLQLRSANYFFNTIWKTLSCTDIKGLHVSIPADKVVKIEIRVPKK